MKPITAFGILALLALPVHSAGTELVLAKDGRSHYRIVVPDGKSSAVDYAAAELQRFLRDISGARLEIITEQQAGSGPAILLGASRRVEKTGLIAEAKKLTGDGVLVKTVGNDIVLLGHGDRGQLNSVYTFLERFLGCRFLAYDCTVTPKKNVLTLPQIDYSYSPPFIYREVLAYDASRWEFASRYTPSMSSSGTMERTSGTTLRRTRTSTVWSRTSGTTLRTALTV